MANPIAHDTVFLEHDNLDFMNGINRCESVISYDADGNQPSDHKELVDNSEFHSIEHLERHIAERLNVSEDIVSIDGQGVAIKMLWHQSRLRGESHGLLQVVVGADPSAAAQRPQETTPTREANKLNALSRVQ